MCLLAASYQHCLVPQLKMLGAAAELLNHNRMQKP
jgi:hypothetical protein